MGIIRISKRRLRGLPHKMRRRRGGPMRGSTQDGVYQTAYIGAGFSTQPTIHAAKRAEELGIKREFAMVEPAWKRHPLDPEEHGLRGVTGIHVYPISAEEFISERKGVKTIRHINIDMPDLSQPSHIKYIIDEARNIVCTNGKIWIKSERKDSLAKVAEYAKKAGLKPHEIKEYNRPSESKKKDKPAKVVAEHKREVGIKSKETKWMAKIKKESKGGKIWLLAITVPPARPARVRKS